MTTTIFTVGTQGQYDEPFLCLLRKHGVDAVIDIRLHSEGRYFKFASGRHIHALVEGAGLAYRHEVAFAPTAAMLKAYKSGGGWASYEPAYQNLIVERQMGDRWTTEYSRYERPCLLCAEVEPIHCH